MLNIHTCGGLAAVAAAVLLSGCDSVLAKKQYVFPTSDEPSAIVRVEKPRTASIGVINLNDEGCWAGVTPLDYPEGRTGTQVGVGKEMVLAYGETIGDQRCSLLVALTPQADAIYTFTTGTWNKTIESKIPVIGKSREQGYCGLAIIKQVGSKASVEPAQQLVVDRGIVCYKYVKRNHVAPVKPAPQP